jgi:hypothetical protein
MQEISNSAGLKRNRVAALLEASHPKVKEERINSRDMISLPGALDRVLSQLGDGGVHRWVETERLSAGMMR